MIWWLSLRSWLFLLVQFDDERYFDSLFYVIYQIPGFSHGITYAK